MARREPCAYGANIGVRGLGAKVEDAFAQPAVVITAVVTDPAQVHLATPVRVRCRVAERGLLCHEWLNTLTFRMGTRHMLLPRFELRIDGAARAADWRERMRR